MIPRECYKYSTGEAQMNQEQISCKENLLEVSGFDWNGALKTNIKDAMFPYKSYVSDEIMWATNMVKSNFMEALKLLTRPQYLPGTLYTLFRQKELEKTIQSFNQQSWRVISPYILKDQHLSNFAKELHWCIFTFLYELGITEEHADRFATIVSHLIEYDNAYRFRIQDLFSEVTKLTPKEIKRLARISKERDSEGVSKKITTIATIISLGLWIPKVKRAFNKVAEGVTIENLYYETDDIYWVALREDYLYQGKTKEQRMKEAYERGWDYPNYPFRDIIQV